MYVAGPGEQSISALSSDPLASILAAPADRPFVVAQLGQSLDGRVATLDGESRWINGPAALDHLHRLRAAVDAVVVGTGTVLADDPELTVRRVPGRSPARVVIDPRGRVPRAARCLQQGGAPRYLVGRAGAALPPGIELIELVPQSETIPPQAIVAALFGRGLRRILVEGGATTISAFLQARALDRLHVLVAPVILGGGKQGLSLPPLARLADALRPPTRAHILPGGDVLFDCDLRATSKE